MSIILTVLVFVLVMVIHELGHAWEMKKQGVDIAEMGIGMPVPLWRVKVDGEFDESGRQIYRRIYIPHFSFPVRLWGMDIEVKLHPVLLGAYVMPSDDGLYTMRSMPDKGLHLIYAGGVIANLITFAVAMLISALVAGVTTKVLVVTTSIVIVCVGLRSFVSSYVLPVFGVLLFGLVLYSFVTMPISETVQGPVQIVSFMHKNIAEINDWLTMVKEATNMLAFLSLVVGMMNCLPIYMLDGGRSFFLYLVKWKVPDKIIGWYVGLSNVVLIALFVLAISSDFISLAK
jgi:membrane-associated protease RseP (regulator of RpoE activity)